MDPAEAYAEEEKRKMREMAKIRQNELALAQLSKM